MAISRWEPFKDLMTLREAMDRLFEESYVPGRPTWAAAGQRLCDLSMDVYTTDEELVIMASVPGLSPDDIDITLEGDTLTIKGEVRAPLDNVTYIIQERPYGTFQRSLRLNIPVEADKAEASFENGILTLVIPKREEVKPKTIKVNTK